MKEFWSENRGNLIGLAPMDGVTDPVFRYLIAENSKPSFLITEFTNVEGLSRGAVKMLPAFFYDEIERPVFAQIYGATPRHFYSTSIFLLYMGFSGIDINMGCPANKVARKGSGAGLIKTPKLAKEIIREVKRARLDFENGISMEKAGVHENIIEYLKGEGLLKPGPLKRSISVKTRLGYEENTISDWIKVLIEEKPDSICVHGRTLNQMYKGEADWEAISSVSDLVRKSDICYLGNGDIKDLKQAKTYIKKYNVDGVMVGRAVMGEPWFFSEKVPSIEDRLKIVKKHAFLMENKYPELNFVSCKKHLAWYLKGFEGAKDLRMKMMMAKDYSEVKAIYESVF